MSGRSASAWLRISLLTILGILATLTLIVGYSLLNPNSLKPLAAFLSETFTGRTLAIEGDVALELSLQPRVVARNVRFGNADWSIRPDMATAGYVLVEMDLTALLDNRVHLMDLIVRDATVYLEDQVDGSPNWALFETADEDTAWSFFIEALELENARLLAEIGELKPIDVEIPELREFSDAAANLQLDGHGRLNGDPWKIDGWIGTFDELLAAGRIEMDLYLIVDDSEIRIRGTVGELDTLSELDLGLEFYGPNTDVLAEIFGMPEAFQEDISLTAAIRPEGTSHTMEVQGHISSFTVAATGSVQDLGDFDGWDAVVDFRGPEAGIFGTALQMRGLPEGPFQVTGRVHIHGGDVDLTDVEITTRNVSLTLNADFEAFPRREGATANIQLTGPDISHFRELLRIPTLPAVPFEFSMALDATGEELLESNLKIGSHTVTAAGPVGEFPTYTGSRLQITVVGEDIAQVLRLAGVEDTLSGPYQTRATLRIDDSGFSASAINLSTGPFELVGEADLPDIKTPKDFTAAGSLSISDLQLAGRLFGIEDLPSRPASVSARLSSSDLSFRLQEGLIDYSHSNIKAEVSGELGTLVGLNGLDLQVHARGGAIEEIFEDALPGTTTPFTFSSRVIGEEDAIKLVGLKLAGEGGSFTVDAKLTLVDGLVGSRFSFQGQGRNLSGLLPSFPYYVPPQKPWQITAEVAVPDAEHLEIEQGSLQVGSINLSVAGKLDTADQTSTNLLIEARGDSIKDVGQISETPLPEIPFRVHTRLEGSRDVINIPRMEVYWGESDIIANGSIDLTGKPYANLTGRSSKMDLIDLQKAIFGEPEDEQPEDDASRVFPDTTILVEHITGFDYDIDIDLEITRFDGVRISLHDVTLRMTFKDLALELDELSFRDQIGSFTASGMLRQEGNLGYLAMNLEGTEADFGLLTSADQEPETIPRYSMDVSVAGEGATVAELAGNLNGSILIYSDGGQINNTLLDAFTGDFFSNVLEVLNPFVASESFTPMECMVVNATIDDGKVRMEPGFIMRTNRVNMFVYGNVNLKNERLDLSLATQARRGIGISAASITNPYFKIGGTLAAPALQLDAASAAVAASVATATAGLSIVIRGLWDRLMGAQNPCPQFLDYKPKTSKDAEADSDG